MVEKLEVIRSAASRYITEDNPETWAIRLAMYLSVRLCSRADQRSPKPFISKAAVQSRKHIYFDPIATVRGLIDSLGEYYGEGIIGSSDADQIITADVCQNGTFSRIAQKHTHAITSPPYINAQDYFRNFKLELHVLEEVLPFDVNGIKHRFIGTERGDLIKDLTGDRIAQIDRFEPEISEIAKASPRHANVVRRYLHDMDTAFENTIDALTDNGVLVLVCGDNLVCGRRICTWQVLTRMLSERHMELFDGFADTIKDRLLAPKRSGHKGIIKQEMVLAFRKARRTTPALATRMHRKTAEIMHSFHSL